MPRIFQTASFEHDLLQIGHHIASESQSLDTSLKFLDRVAQKCHLYAVQPRMGAPRDDLGTDIHVFSVESYVVIYRPIEHGIELLMLVHGARNIPPLFAERFADE